MLAYLFCPLSKPVSPGMSELPEKPPGCHLRRWKGIRTPPVWFLRRKDTTLSDNNLLGCKNNAVIRLPGNGILFTAACSAIPEISLFCRLNHPISCLMKRTVLLILVSHRKETAEMVQKILTGWGCFIKTRLGIHDGVLENCSDSGLIFLELTGDKEKQEEITRKLNLVKGVDARLIFLEV